MYIKSLDFLKIISVNIWVEVCFLGVGFGYVVTNIQRAL